MRKHTIVLALLLLIVLALSVSAGAAQDAAVDPVASGKWGVEPATAQLVEGKGDNEVATYIVVLDAEPLATYKGGVPGFAATSAAAQGDVKLDVTSRASQAYLNYLDGQRSVAISAASKALGRDLNVTYAYKATLNGFAAEMTGAEADALARMEGVRFVEKEKISQPTTDAGPLWINADDIWAGLGGNPGTFGEGIIVGVIDTGIDPWNPSFADIGGDGYDHTNPFGTGNYVGVCDPANTTPGDGIVDYDSTFPCNDKLIGAWGYEAVSPSPRDSNGHGSHTASTAAGNFVFGATVTTPTDSYTADISGVAPHANVIMYAACCAGSALNAARDQALLDGVDVINYSIGASSPTVNVWTDSETLQWLALRDAGVFVATSAGNNGPGSNTVFSPADAPWIMSVGANSHNRAFLNSITLDNGVDAPITVEGLAMTSGYGPAPVVFAADYPPFGDDARLCADGVFAPGTFSGEIVVCERGVYGRVAKGQTVLDGGAGGYILAQPDEFGGGPGSLATDPHVLPAVHIDYYGYQDLKNYIALTGSANGTIAGATLDTDPANGDIMAAFSSRGPNSSVPDVIVPSVTAPGRGIWAAYHQGAGGDGDYTFNVISGTSMSSPHAAGAGALLMALHPDWSPAEIQSALMTTARTSVLNDDGVSPTTATVFDIGSGHIDLALAGQAGLLLDVTTTEYLDADPDAGGDPKDLNLASLGNAQCVGTCSWTRTVTSSSDATETWTATTSSPDGLVITVSPDVFTLDPGAEQVLTITADASATTVGEWSLGDVLLTSDGASPDAHLPVAVIFSLGNVPEQANIITRRDAGSKLLADLEAIEITDLTIEVSGLTIATQEALSLSQDPTNGDPYDNLNDGTTQYFNVTVPAGATRFVAETFDSTAPDIDLFVGTGLVPSAATQVCSSTTPTAAEYCSLDDPAAGDWWILVQNWSESAAPPDTLTLSYGVVSGDAGNMHVEGPASNPAGALFDLRVFFNEPAMEAGDRLYGQFSVGSDAANPGNVGRVDVNIQRFPDDVTKSVSSDTAVPGDTLTYTINVAPNILDQDLTYVITDTIPAGMTYVPGSATATIGTVDVTGDTLTWTGVAAVPSYTYAISTSDTDPTCAAPLAGFDDNPADSYVNLAAFGIAPGSTIFGDTVTYAVDLAGGAFDFFGSPQGEILNFTDDGFAFFDPSTSGATPWVNQPIPTADDPNNLLAIFWRDMEIVYDGALGRGVSLANLTSGGVPVAGVIEYDDVEDWPAGSNPTYDFEVIAYYDADPARYEYIFAYDNLTGPVTVGTIGLENADGSDGVQYGFNDLTITDGMAICFDRVGAGGDLIEITYDVTVDFGASGTLTNNVVHNTDAIGSMEASTSVDVVVDGLNLYVSANSRGVSGGVAFADEDILAHDPVTGWSMYFDGSDVGLKSTDVDALHLMDDGSILMSFEQKINIAGFGKVQPQDIVRFIPTSLGEDTAGSFEMYFNGSDFGLKKYGEGVDAIAFTPDGRLVVSTLAALKVPQTGGGMLRASDDDLIVLNATDDWEMYLDGSDVWHYTEDVWGSWINAATGDIYLSMQNEFTAGPVSGDQLDVFICQPDSLGADSACTFSMYFDGSVEGFGGDRIDGFAIGH